jgi:hypothetical protein
MSTLASFNASLYETIAQVIPVLIAVLFFESGYGRRREGRPLWAWWVICGLVLLVVAEWVALDAVNTRETPPVWPDRALIFLSLTWGFVGIILHVLDEHVRDPERWILQVEVGVLVASVVGLILSVGFDFRPVAIVAWAALAFFAAMISFVPVYARRISSREKS